MSNQEIIEVNYKLIRHCLYGSLSPLFAFYRDSLDKTYAGQMQEVFTKYINAMSEILVFVKDHMKEDAVKTTKQELEDAVKEEGE